MSDTIDCQMYIFYLAADSQRKAYMKF